MRVRFVLRSFGGPGGTEKYAADLAGWLVGQGISVEVCCARWRVVPAGVCVRSIADPQCSERAFARASRDLPRDGIDVVQGFGRSVGHDVWRAGGGAHLAWLEARSGRRLGRLAARVLPGERWRVDADLQALAGARRVICNSEMAARDLVEAYGVARDVIAVVRNGVDGQRFRPDPAARAAARGRWGVPEGGRVAVFLGTGFRRKGLYTAARAFGLSAGARDRFVVIGRDGGAWWRLRDVRRWVGERLVVQGPVVDPERWLPGADATLLPTAYDPAANTTLEAMACGVPAVTSTRDGNAEVVPDARLVGGEPGDAEGFGRALEFAWGAGPRLAEDCREAASRWTVARNGATMIHIYREIIDG